MGSNFGGVGSCEHFIYDRRMSLLNESCVYMTHSWSTHMVDSCHFWMSHVCTSLIQKWHESTINKMCSCVYMTHSCVCVHHSFMWVMSHTRMSHVTHTNESCHTHEWVMYTHEWVMNEWCTHTNESCTHMNESCVSKNGRHGRKFWGCQIVRTF